MNRKVLPVNVTNRSRERRAKVMDGVAVALLLAVSALLGVCAMLLAADAKADPSDEVLNYTSIYGPSAVCPVLDTHHTVTGVLGVLLAVVDDGFDEFDAGQIVGMSVIQYCPRHQPLLQQFVGVYGEKSVLA